jgi:hypothetical protein
MLSNQCFINPIGTWHFATFCKWMVCMLSNQCFIHSIGSWHNTTFCKWTVCMLSNWCFIHLIGTLVWYNHSQEVACMFTGCKTVMVVELYAWAVCSRMGGWDVGLITSYASVGGLGESPLHDIRCGISLTKELRNWQGMRHWQCFGNRPGQV